MTAQDIGLATPDSMATAPASARAGNRAVRTDVLFHPVIDFLCLGGISLLFLPVLALLAPAELWQPRIALGALLATNIINHPHFANSYQIFYRNFRNKAFGQDYGPVLRARYVIAGIVVPAALAAFLAYAILSGDAHLLGIGGGIMALTAGWHYVKQGYGMIIVDSVLKRRFFDAAEKKVLLVNAYACWVVSWVLVNQMIAERDLWGLKYYAIPLPKAVLVVAALAALATTLAMLYMLGRKWLKTGVRPPVNGTMSYLITLYAWMVFVRIDPLFLLIVPALHSLQYLVVVWRYQLNIEHDKPDAGQPLGARMSGRFLGMPRWVNRFAGFVITGIVLGFVAFWGGPILLDAVVPYDKAVFGGTMFLFVCWVFVNVHHYFLDNVMWRRENPETGKYLFARA